METEPRPSLPTGWAEALDQVDEKHVDAHKRIRDDLERTASMLSTLATRVESNYNYFVLQQGALQRSVDEAKALATRPINGTAVVWDTKTVIGVIAAIVVGVLMYADLKQANKDLRRELSESTTVTTKAIDETTKAIAEIKKQAENDKKDNMERLSQFLNRDLKSSLDTANAIAGKGVKK